MKNLFTNVLDALGFGSDWWIKVVTKAPECTYYFGPYDSKAEAEAEQFGFIEDLKGENAVIVSQEVLRTNPTEYTIYDERTDFLGINPRPVFSGRS